MYSSREISSILDRCKNSLHQPKNEYPVEIYRSLLFINNSIFNDKLTIEFVKQKCHIKSKSFHTKFFIYTGFYPKKYILHHRLNAAKLLLEQNSISTTQIALAVGFRSQSAFCNSFKKNWGASPLKWRKKKKIKN